MTDVVLHPRRFAAHCQKALRRLRRLYQALLRRRGHLAPAFAEWLHDNYYLIERECSAALRELARLAPDAVVFAAVMRLCAQLCPHGELPGADPLLRRLARVHCDAEACDLLPLALRLTLVRFAVDAVDAPTSEAQSTQIRNAVQSFRALPDIDFALLQEQISPVDAVLRRDPSGVYLQMDEGSRAVYRHLVAQQAKARKVSATGYAKQLLAWCQGAAAEKHIGSLLLRRATPQKRGRLLLWCETLAPLVVSFAMGIWLRSLWVALLLVLPLWAVLRVLLESALLRGVTPVPLPRLELHGTVPEHAKTLVVVSTLLPDAAHAGALKERMESLWHSNGGEHVWVCVLADLPAAASETTADDAEALRAAEDALLQLQARYGAHFLLAVRRRRYSATMQHFAGRERKRGAIADLVQVLRGFVDASQEFCLFAGGEALPLFRFMLALDADTQVPLGTVQEMVAAALHPANQPRFDPACGRVTEGYGVLVPAVDSELAGARKSWFAQLLGGEGGNSPYSNLVPERYQDLFGSSVFAGKGLLVIDAFALVAEARPFPAEQVLSHDIVEGGYLRVGLLADVHVADAFPGKASSYFARQERWVRGDVQNCLFLRKRAGLSGLARYQLFDNLRRALLPVACFLAVLLSPLAGGTAGFVLLLCGLLGMSFGHALAALRSLLVGGVAMVTRRYFSGGLPAALGAATRGLLQVMLLPLAAWVCGSGAAKALWRSFVSRRHRLAWTTAAQSDAAKTTWRQALAFLPAVLAGLCLAVAGGVAHWGVAVLFWLAIPFAVWSSRPRREAAPALLPSDAEELRAYCAQMWKYFETYATHEHHYFPPDNVQESPVFRVAARTSPTNIGLFLLCLLAARDLDLIDSAGLALRLQRSLQSLEQLETWQGHLYNWYDTRSLRPLEPRYVSTVDSGNWLVALRTLRMGLPDYAEECPELHALLPRLQALEDACDLRPLYHKRRRLFCIGMDVSQGERLSASYYDLLMSEARMTSYYAIATRVVPKPHWGALGRTLAQQGRFVGPVSWTGTMFEYFMPHLFLPAPKGTLGYEALRFGLRCQQLRTAARRLPWGSSESGFYAFDAELNYQYKAHGVQKLGLRRGLDEELVLAPYASFLALQLQPQAGMQNLRRFARMGLCGACGFYEAVDATPARLQGQDYAPVRSYMAHHVGMSFLAALNALQNGVLRRRFMRDPQMQSASTLLEERIPESATVFNDVDLRDPPQPRERVATARQSFVAMDPAKPRAHLLCNGEWTHVASDCGAGLSLYRGASLLRHSPDLLRQPGGLQVFVQEPGKALVAVLPAPLYNAHRSKVEFAANEVVHMGESEHFAVSVHTRVHASLPAEVRRLVVKNTSRRVAKAEILVYGEPSLAPLREEAEHPAFARLFLTDWYDADTGVAVFLRRRRDSQETLSLAMGFDVTDSVHCERQRLLARPRGQLCRMETDGGTGNPDSCACFAVPVQLRPGESRELRFLLCAGVTPEEAAQRLHFLRQEHAHRLALGKGDAAALCPFRAGEMQLALAQKIVPKLLWFAPVHCEEAAARAACDCPKEALWALGVSGDVPYFYLPVRSAEDLPGAVPWLQLFARLRAAMVPCELVLSYSESGDYDAPLQHAIAAALQRERVASGFVLVNLQRVPAHSASLLGAYAAHICGDTAVAAPALGQAMVPLPLQEQRVPAVPPVGSVPCGAGYFSADLQRFCVGSDPLPPVPWSFALCNAAFGTLVSDRALGFSWAVNARENKISPWYNDTGDDNRGEMLLLRLGGAIFDLCRCGTCSFVPGDHAYALWQGKVQGLDYALRVHVPAKGLVKRVDLQLRNTSAETVQADVAYLLEPVLGVRREPHVPLQCETLPDGMLLHNPAAAVQGYAALLLQGGADWLCGDRAAFLAGQWQTTAMQGDPCAAVGRAVGLAPNEAVQLHFVLAWGATSHAALCADFVAGEPSAAEAEAAFGSDAPMANHVVAQADETGSLGPTAQTQEPNHAMLQAMQTLWLPHQALTARIWGRCGHAQCGGAYGFRDQLQDVLAFVATDPQLVRRHLLRCAAAQFEEGDAMHWWHRLPGHTTRGVRTRYADDYLWLPFVAGAYWEQTQDTSLLHCLVPFRQGEPLGEAHERYGAYALGGERASFYVHCWRAVELALTRMGAHGLPLMLGGDWNDGMNRVGCQGQGESVWMAMFLAMVLERMVRLAEAMQEPERACRYAEEAERLRVAVDAHAWAGDRYLRAFWDDGTPLGGADSSACAIDLLPQSFAVLCNMPNQERRETALQTALAQLGDAEHCLLRLLHAPFEAGEKRAGYINEYPPGVRENGGQYTHAALWFCLALLQQGHRALAKEWLCRLLPGIACQNPEQAARYQGEPYALAGDVLTAPGCLGRAGWTQYTGSAAWAIVLLRSLAEPTQEANGTTPKK